MAVYHSAQSIYGTLRQRGIDIPLLGSVHKTYAATGGNTYSALDYFDTGSLLVTENALIPV